MFFKYTDDIDGKPFILNANSDPFITFRYVLIKKIAEASIGDE